MHAYVFGVTEPQQFKLELTGRGSSKGKGKGRTGGRRNNDTAQADGAQDQDEGAESEEGPVAEVLPVPVMVVAISGTPPPEMLGITSVQRSSEEIVPMRSLKMGWYQRGAVEQVEAKRRRRSLVAGDKAGATDDAPGRRVHMLGCRQRVRTGTAVVRCGACAVGCSSSSCRCSSHARVFGVHVN